MNDILANYFDAIADRTDDSDWRDVLRRAARGRRPLGPLFVAALVGAAMAAAPALAFSTSVQELIGLKKPAPPPSTSWNHPRLLAKVTGMSYHRLSRYGLPLVTVKFTIGEVGKPPGTGVTFGSYFLVDVESKTGKPFLPVLGVRAYGSRGHYEATFPTPPGGIGGIKIAGFINHPTGPSEANGTLWIPVIIPVQGH